MAAREGPGCRCGIATQAQAKPMASDAKNSTPWTGRSRSTPGSKDRPGRKRPPARESPPPLTWRPLLFGGTRVTTRSTALCSSERILASFRGSRLTPERSSKSSDLSYRALNDQIRVNTNDQVSIKQIRRNAKDLLLTHYGNYNEPHRSTELEIRQ